MTIIAIDPGPEKSAFVLWDGAQVLNYGITTNAEVLRHLQLIGRGVCHLVIEKIANYGMAVGEEVFETVYWSGIFAHAFGLARTSRLTRGEIKHHLCRSSKAKDANVRQAILDRFGGKEKAIGRKACPGPLHGISSHCWAALAVALTHWDLSNAQKSTIP